MPETFSYEDAFATPAPAAARPAPAGPQTFSYEDALADMGGGRPLTVHAAAPPMSWGDTAADLVQSAATGIEKGAIGMATLPVTLERGAHAIYDATLGRLVTKALGPAPHGTKSPDLGDYLGPEAVTRSLESQIGPMYQPQSTAGHYAETVGEFAGGGGRSAVKSVGSFVKNALVPGLASEGAGQATEGTWLEPYARGVAPILAGGLAHYAGGPGTPGKVLADAAGRLDPATLDAAQSLMDAAQRQGTPLSLAEAVQQVTNSGTRLGSLQRVVEQSRGGADPMARFYADRPGQVQQAGNAAIDQIGPVPAVPLDGSMGPVQPNPSAVGPAVQRAAQGALADAPQSRAAADALAGAGPRVTPEQAGQVMQPGLRGVYDQRLGARSTQARQDYAAAGSDTIPTEAVQGIIDDLDAQIGADKTGLLAQQLGAFRSRLIDRTAKPTSSGFELDPATEARPTGAPPPEVPPADYDAMGKPARPSVPRPQTLQGLVKSLGGVQDPRGDLKAMGMDAISGVIAKPGKGLGQDAVRQIAAEQGYLGANIDDAMANTTPNDLINALGEHPVHSVRDADAAHQWDAYDSARLEADQYGNPAARRARPLSAPLPDIDPLAPTPARPVPITDIANLNRIRKTFRDRIDLPSVAPKAIDKETAATMGPILGDLDRVMAEGSPAYAKANQNFAANSAPLEPFENSPALSAAIERDGFDKRFMTPAEQVPGLIDKGGSSAARTFNSVAPASSRSAYESHVATQMLEKATGANGLVDADRLNQAMRDQADALQHYPTVRATLQRVIETQRATAPLRSTLVGRLAATPAFREQAALVLDNNPLPGGAHEVADAVRSIATRSPEAARALVSQRIRQSFNEATQNNVSGPNQWGGAKFAAVIAGNDQQARNLRAAVEALHGPAFWDDFRQFLDVMEAMGRRQAPGSGTEFNRQMAVEMQKGGVAGQAIATGASPGSWMTKARDIYDGWRYGRNTEALADMLTRPDAAKRLAGIAKAPKGSAQSQGMAAMLLLGASANQARKN